MAEPTYILLDGTVAAVDMTIAPTAVGAQSSIRCIASYISLMFRRGTTQRVTFCENGWSKPSAGMRQGFGHIDGFSSKGGPLSDPLAMFNQNDPLPFTFTADAGLTFTGKLVLTQDMTGVRAFAEHARGIDFETYGIISTLWVVA